MYQECCNKQCRQVSCFINTGEYEVCQECGATQSAPIDNTPEYRIFESDDAHKEHYTFDKSAVKTYGSFVEGPGAAKLSKAQGKATAAESKLLKQCSELSTLSQRLGILKRYEHQAQELLVLVKEKKRRYNINEQAVFLACIYSVLKESGDSTRTPKELVYSSGAGVTINQFAKALKFVQECKREQMSKDEGNNPIPKPTTPSSSNSISSQQNDLTRRCCSTLKIEPKVAEKCVQKCALLSQMFSGRAPRTLVCAAIYLGIKEENLHTKIDLTTVAQVCNVAMTTVKNLLQEYVKNLKQ